jgi:hypothetical protein
MLRGDPAMDAGPQNTLIRRDIRATEPRAHASHRAATRSALDAGGPVLDAHWAKRGTVSCEPVQCGYGVEYGVELGAHAGRADLAEEFPAGCCLDGVVVRVAFEVDDGVRVVGPCRTWGSEDRRLLREGTWSPYGTSVETFLVAGASFPGIRETGGRRCACRSACWCWSRCRFSLLVA